MYMGGGEGEEAGAGLAATGAAGGAGNDPTQYPLLGNPTSKSINCKIIEV